MTHASTTRAHHERSYSRQSAPSPRRIQTALGRDHRSQRSLTSTAQLSQGPSRSRNEFAPTSQSRLTYLCTDSSNSAVNRYSLLDSEISHWSRSTEAALDTRDGLDGQLKRTGKRSARGCRPRSGRRRRLEHFGNNQDTIDQLCQRMARLRLDNEPARPQSVQESVEQHPMPHNDFTFSFPIKDEQLRFQRKAYNPPKVPSPMTLTKHILEKSPNVITQPESYWTRVTARTSKPKTKFHDSLLPALSKMWVFPRNDALCCPTTVNGFAHVSSFTSDTSQPSRNRPVVSAAERALMTYSMQTKGTPHSVTSKSESPSPAPLPLVRSPTCHRHVATLDSSGIPLPKPAPSSTTSSALSKSLVMACTHPARASSRPTSSPDSIFRRRAVAVAPPKNRYALSSPATLGTGLSNAQSATPVVFDNKARGSSEAVSLKTQQELQMFLEHGHASECWCRRRAKPKGRPLGHDEGFLAERAFAPLEQIHIESTGDKRNLAPARSVPTPTPTTSSHTAAESDGESVLLTPSTTDNDYEDLALDSDFELPTPSRNQDESGHESEGWDVVDCNDNSSTPQSRTNTSNSSATDIEEKPFSAVQWPLISDDSLQEYQSPSSCSTLSLSSWTDHDGHETLVSDESWTLPTHRPATFDTKRREDEHAAVFASATAVEWPLLKDAVQMKRTKRGCKSGTAAWV